MLPGMRSALLPIAVAGLVSCTAPTGTRPTAPGASEARDARVRSFLGRVPPEIAPDARWIGAPAASLAALRGRVVYLQFAFPT